MTLPVSCVERGRWRPDAKSFSVSESAYPTLRRAKSSQVVRSLRAGERHQADQGAIWNEVATRQAAASVHSATEALRDLYADRHARLTTYVRALPYPRNTVGAIVGYGGRIVSLELFDSPEILKRRWSRLIRAAALDALVSKPAAAISTTRAIRMLHRPQRADVLRFTTPGLGTDLRLAGGGVEGAALLHDEIVVHAAFHRVAA
jgi:hypothetical protein